ncbi:MAG: NAD(P)/FAD-dependent oxidoreductase [Microbacterium sp.]
MTRTVIVGGSVGGIKTAQSLRAGGYGGEIVIVEQEELSAPYDKPPLSKAYLLSGDGLSTIPLVDERELRDLRIRWHGGVAASGIDIAAKSLHLADGTRLPYDALVIATGSRARPSPWGEDPAIHVLRTATDAERLRSALRPGRRLAIIGGGFIGSEVAATARRVGVEVTMIDPLPAPMSRALNEEVGRLFAEKHAAEGVHLRFGKGVDLLHAGESGVSLTLTGGEKVTVDQVLVGIGAIVNTEWLEGTPLTVDNGIVTDSCLRAVGAEDVYVVGDICRWQRVDGLGTSRLEHWTSATDQARLVAHNILEPDEASSYEPVEYVWSDQYDWKIQVVGRTGAADWRLIGDPSAGRFAVTYAADGRASGAVIVNWPRALVASRRAVRDGDDAGELRRALEDLRTPRPVP